MKNPAVNLTTSIKILDNNTAMGTDTNRIFHTFVNDVIFYCQLLLPNAPDIFSCKFSDEGRQIVLLIGIVSYMFIAFWLSASTLSSHVVIYLFG